MATRNYYPQLDSLRAFAAIGVINLHWLGSSYPSLFGLAHESNWGFGQYGVQLFFVLSGFLITDILISSKDSSGSRLGIIVNFYARRSFRLFPVYFLFLGYLILVRDRFVIENIAWFASYTVNVRLFIAGSFVDQWSNHLWTLSVEEQFYLVFPPLFLYCSRERERWLAAVFIVTAMVFKQANATSGEIARVLTVAQMDMLGGGVLLGILKNRHVHAYQLLASSQARFLMLVAFVGCILMYYTGAEGPLIGVLFDGLLLIAFGLLVVNTAVGFGGLSGAVLNSDALQYLGKISYGLYVYHKAVPLSIAIVAGKLGLVVESVLSYYLVNLLALLIVSHMSWVIIEKPVMKLKTRFDSLG